MIQIIRDIKQGSDEWFELCLGSIGASTISKIITSTGKKSTQRKAYMYKLAGEKITGKKEESYSNLHMENGLEREEKSKKFFEISEGVEVEDIAMIFPFEGAGYHCSPDGIIIGKEEGFEQKNVIASTQAKYLDKGILPTEYRLQCQFSLFVTGWVLWHFMSSHPGMKRLKLKVKRDEKLISVIKKETDLFLEELDILVKKLKN